MNQKSETTKKKFIIKTSGSITTETLGSFTTETTEPITRLPTSTFTAVLKATSRVTSCQATRRSRARKGFDNGN